MPPIEELIGNRFEVHDLVKTGGAGSIYRAVDQVTGSWVALKMPKISTVSSRDKERFARETRLLMELQHPGIVRYVSHGISERGQPYLVMEWLEGEDLRQRLERQSLSLAEALQIMKKVARALKVVHGLGIIHRDLKPSNLFLRNGEVGRAMLIDFGIARRNTRSGILTSTGNIVGTPEIFSDSRR